MLYKLHAVEVEYVIYIQHIIYNKLIYKYALYIYIYLCVIYVYIDMCFNNMYYICCIY